MPKARLRHHGSAARRRSVPGLILAGFAEPALSTMLGGRARILHGLFAKNKESFCCESHHRAGPVLL
jgi:hypothetical protein